MRIKAPKQLKSMNEEYGATKNRH